MAAGFIAPHFSTAAARAVGSMSQIAATCSVETEMLLSTWRKSVVPRPPTPMKPSLKKSLGPAAPRADRDGSPARMEPPAATPAAPRK
jgi:hypothetical protein